MSYLQMLGLTEEPFRGNEAKSYYLPAVKGNFEILQGSLSDKFGISFIIGEEGSGKTALLKYLSENSPNDWRLVCLTLTPGASGDDILEQLLGHFHVVVNKNIDQDMYRQQMLSALSIRLKELALVKLTPILLIDNGECLDTRSLQTIFDLNELNKGEQGSLKLVLSGRPEVLDIVKQAEFADQHSSIKIIALESLKSSQLENYILFRLNAAGYKSSLPFTTDEMEVVHADSQGNPARINELVDNLLTKKTKDYGSLMETVESHKKSEIEPEFNIAEEEKMAYPGNDSKSENDIDELAFSIQKQINSFDEVQNLADDSEDKSTDDLAQQLEQELAESQQFLRGDGQNHSFLSPKYLIPGVAVLFVFISGATYFLLSDDSQDIRSTGEETISQPLALPEHNVNINEPNLAIPSKQETTTELVRSQPPNTAPSGEKIQESSAKEIKKIPLIFLDDDVLEVVDAEKLSRKEIDNDTVAETREMEPSVKTKLIENDKKIDELIPNKEQALAVPFAHDSKSQLSSEVVKKPTNITPITPAPKINGVSPTPIIGSNKRQGISIAGNDFNQETQLILNWDVSGKKKEKVFSARLTPSQFKYENSKQIRLFVNTGTDTGKWQVQAVNSDNAHSEIVTFEVVEPFKKQVSKAKKTNKSEKKKLDAKNFMSTQPDDFFTIQLLSSSNLSAIEELRKKHKITDKSTIIPIKRNGKQLYSLVYGGFKNKSAAAKAYKKLPRQLNKNRLWIRKVGDVKELLGKSPQVPPKRLKKSLDKKELSVRNEKFIVSRDPKLWTFQLISLGSVSDMKQYIKNNKIEKGAHFFKRTVNGKTRYTLVYGVYKSRKLAQEQLASLPKNIRAGKPWIRQYADIQALMSN